MEIQTKLKSFLHSSQTQLVEKLIEEIINDLETNPNADGTTSPNIQHWIEQKQIQLKRKYFDYLKGINEKDTMPQM